MAEISEEEAELRARVDAARSLYEATKERAASLLEISQDLGSNNPDGLAAIRKSSADLSHATTEYARVLIEFSEFLLRKRLRA
jgi:hypothetical protein